MSKDTVEVPSIVKLKIVLQERIDFLRECQSRGDYGESIQELQRTINIIDNKDGHIYRN